MSHGRCFSCLEGGGGGAALYRWEGISSGAGMKGRMEERKVRLSPAARAAEVQTGVRRMRGEKRLN